MGLFCHIRGAVDKSHTNNTYSINLLPTTYIVYLSYFHRWEKPGRTQLKTEVTQLETDAY